GVGGGVGGWGGVDALPAPAPAPVPAPASAPASRISFRSEAPLWVFSLLVSVLVGVTATGAGRAGLPWPAFLLGAAVAAAASTFHLGRPLRAWRAVLGWRTSWLSREVVLFNLFAVTGTLELAGVLPALGRAVAPWAEPATGWGVTALGFATLLSMDRVYHVTRTPGLEAHSARTLLTGLLAAGVVAGSPPVWAPVLGLKLLLYGARKHRRALRARGWRPALSGLRVGSALAGASLLAAGTPVATVLLGPGAPEGDLLAGPAQFTVVLGALLLLVGEMIDRGEFYAELEVRTPAAQVRIDLAARVRALAEGGHTRP
ncbi:MAG: DmsC/YnfH family molybdoenzyme membrane anchor subunit, partial [Longimicrobiales bacterium]|nr:DmsC/YnfH family molybdoenzyme membrane anchor subunit [Longimicrobiales bacterium]